MVFLLCFFLLLSLPNLTYTSIYIHLLMPHIIMNDNATSDE